MFAVVAVKFCFYPPIERYSCCTDIFVFEAVISLITNYSTHSRFLQLEYLLRESFTLTSVLLEVNVQQSRCSVRKPATINLSFA